MINISLETHPDLYVDYVKCIDFLKLIAEDNYTYPGHSVNYHVYSEVRTDKEMLCIKSFFATQNLNKSKLVLWSDWDVTGNEMLQPFKDLIDFRVYDPVELARGTILEGRTQLLLAKDTKHYMMSGMLRFLALFKEGGFWVDMDMILLRDLVPIMDQEFAYQWGSETDFKGFGPCAAFMNIFSHSEHATICLEEIIKAPVRANTVSRDCEMLAKVYQRRPFTVFPSPFFNAEWLINKKYPPLGDIVQNGWFRKTDHSTWLFPESFAWHWHNSSSRNHTIEPGSKFDLLTKMMDTKLKERGF
jgi:hypothetical protein